MEHMDAGSLTSLIQARFSQGLTFSEPEMAGLLRHVCECMQEGVVWVDSGVVKVLSYLPPPYLSCSLPVCLSVCPSVCLSVRLSLGLSIYLPVYLSVCLSACLPVCLSVCQSACLSACLSVSLSVCLSVRLSVCSLGALVACEKSGWCDDVGVWVCKCWCRCKCWYGCWRVCVPLLLSVSFCVCTRSS